MYIYIYTHTYEHNIIFQKFARFVVIYLKIEEKSIHQTMSIKIYVDLYNDMECSFMNTRIFLELFSLILIFFFGSGIWNGAVQQTHVKAK